MSCELAERLEAWGRDNVSHQEGPAWYEFMGLVSLVEELDERFTEERIEHSKLAAESVRIQAKAAEVVAELRSLARGVTSNTASNAFSDASDIVAEKLGVKS